MFVKQILDAVRRRGHRVTLAHEEASGYTIVPGVGVQLEPIQYDPTTAQIYVVGDDQTYSETQIEQAINRAEALYEE